MAPSGLPEDVLAFLRAHISSVTQLEFLVVLVSSGTSRSLVELARELRVDPGHAEAQLSSLTGCGLLTFDEHGFCYAPRSKTLDRGAKRLVALYETHRVAITTAIYAPRDDAGPDPLRGFSDAFRLRKEEE